MYDLAIVGAGPAGISAALTAVRHGASVVVIDEQQRVGGQIFRQPPREFGATRPSISAGYPWARALIAEAENTDAVTWKHSTTAFGVFRDRDDGRDTIQLAATGPDGPECIPARRLLIATGAYDLPVAIPGWTLPGVMMAGAVQGFLKSQKLLISERLVLAGSHPLLVVVADQLRAAGANIAEIAFARGLPGLLESLRALPALPRHVRLFTETGMALGRLRRAGVRISTHTVVTEALGSRHVEAVRLAPVDKDWRVTGPGRTVPTSALVLGYGFQPATELARQAGCSLSWDSARGGWVVDHDETMQTTESGIYVAGEPTGVAGAEQSRAQGLLAGLTVVQSLNRNRSTAAAFEDAVRRAHKNLRRADRFSRVVQRMFAPHRDSLSALTTPDTTVCRCELISRAEVTDVLRSNPGISTANAVKLECRAGMGPCQGRYCETTISMIVAAERARPIDQVGRFTAHVPVKPVPVSAYTILDGAPPGNA